MRNIVNERFLNSRTKWAKIMSFTGLGSLFICLILINRLIFVAWGILIVGLVVSSIGANLASRYIREPTAVSVLEKALAGFDDRHVLYHYSLPVEHLLVTPSGIWVIHARKQPGKISFDGRKWRQKLTLGRIIGFLGEPGMGNPTRELQYDLDRVKEKLQEELPDTEIPVEGVVVFTDPRAELDVKGTASSIVTGENLKTFFRRTLKDKPPVPSAQQRDIQRVIDAWRA